MTMLSAIRDKGVIQDATVVVDGAMNGQTFLNYVEQFLVPSLRPGDTSGGGGHGQLGEPQGQGGA